MDSIYTVGYGSLLMVSEPIPDPGVGVCLTPYEVFICLARNPMGHNKDVVSAWRGECDIPHWIQKKVPNAMYVEALFNYLDVF